jgi:hypothetical protein
VSRNRVKINWNVDRKAARRKLGYKTELFQAVKELGGSPFLDVIPVRVANSVVLFENRAIGKAFDYVHELFQYPAKRTHVITMSMGGLASQAWADAVLTRFMKRESSSLQPQAILW